MVWLRLTLRRFEQRSQDLMKSGQRHAGFGTHARRRPHLHPQVLGSVGPVCQKDRLARSRLTPEQQSTATVRSIGEKRV
jgi:hypothetical protein